MIKTLEKIERVITAVLFIAILLTVLWQIITRKLLGSPSQWTDEFSRLLFVYIAMLGCHIAQRENIHVRIDAILTKFSEKTKLIIEFCINFVMTGIFILITYYGCEIVSSAGVNDKLVTLNLSVSTINFSLIVLGVLMSLEMIAQMVNIVKNKKVVRPC